MVSSILQFEMGAMAESIDCQMGRRPLDYANSTRVGRSSAVSDSEAFARPGPGYDKNCVISLATRFSAGLVRAIAGSWPRAALQILEAGLDPRWRAANVPNKPPHDNEACFAS